MKISAIKQGGMIKWQVLAILVLLLLGSLQLADGREVNKNKVTIEYPKNGEQVQVGKKITAIGTYEIPDKSHGIWIWVHTNKRSAKPSAHPWIPQEKPVVDKKGNWQANVYVSKDIGSKFEIVAATFDKETVAKIQWSVNKKILIDFPKPTSNEAVVTVTVKRVK